MDAKEPWYSNIEQNLDKPSNSTEPKIDTAPIGMM